jgi:hypothetical protein
MACSIVCEEHAGIVYKDSDFKSDLDSFFKKNWFLFDFQKYDLAILNDKNQT